MESPLGRCQDFLICSYPRSRTLWLSKFLTVSGVSFCAHEATEFAGSSAEFWANADKVKAETGWPIFGNSDSANLFVLPALLSARPMTKVLWIERPIEEVKRSMVGAGFDLPESTAKKLVYLRSRYQDLFDFVINYQTLRDPDYCRWLWNYLLGAHVGFDYGWWLSMDQTRIAYDAATKPPRGRDTVKFLQFIEDEMERPTQWHTQQ